MTARLLERRFELRTLMVVWLLLGGAAILTQLGLDVSEEVAFTWESAVWIAPLVRVGLVLLIASGLLARFRPKTDQTILPIIGLIGGLSIILMYRLPTPYWDEAQRRFLYATRNAWYVERQTAFLIGSIALATVTALAPFDLLRYLRRYRYWAVFVSVGLLIVTAGWGVESAEGGARVALDVGLFTFQPSELVKLLFVIFLASYLTAGDLGRFSYRFYGIPLPNLFRYLLPLTFIFTAALVALVLMSDLGVALILFGVFPIMIFIALPPRLVRQLLGLTVAAALLIYLIYAQLQGMVTWSPTLPLKLPTAISERIAQSTARVGARANNWQDPWAACTPASDCASYQTLEGLYAIAAGGVWGAGGGMGDVEYVPFAHTDLVFAILAEEWGALGCIALLGLYLLLIQRGLRIANRQAEPFPFLLTTGLVTLFALQLLIILGGTLNLLPLTGITVPFLSFGGTSLLVNGMIVGLLLRTSHSQSRSRIQRPNLRMLTRAYTSGFGVLLIGVLYWTIWMAPILHPSFPDRNPYTDNIVAWQRQAAWLNRVERGRILAADGTVLAANGVNGRELRLLAGAHVVGMADGRGMGLSGIEAAHNGALLGQGRYDGQTLWARYTNGRWQGNDVQLTLDPQWQSVAHAALGGYNGAVVVLDAQTGAVLAMVSHPTFDPAALQDRTQFDALRTQADSPLINRAIDGLYPPGSTFKAVVAAAGLSAEITTPDTLYDYLDHYWFTDDAGRLCHREWIGAGVIESCNTTLQQMTLREGFAWSDNILFAQMAGEVGGDALWETATQFGFNQAIPFDLPLAQAQIANDKTWLNDPAQLAMTGFGQSQVIATPLHMALVATAAVNGGNVPQPYLVQSVIKPNGKLLETTEPTVLGEVFSAEQAAQLHDIMQAAVTDGWASAAQVEGITVGGKTGTAEWVSNGYPQTPHSWYIGFAELPNSNPVAIAVLAEAAGDGSQVAAPIAGNILRAMVTP